MVDENDHPNVSTLRTIYGSLSSSVAEFVADDVVLHIPVRDPDGNRIQIRGKEKVLEYEAASIKIAADILDISVEHIYANDFFGVAFGKMMIGDDLATPFCGLWRFADGKITEHWENPYDADALMARLSS
ncbi:nuclear transport factor 2 family protein [Streptomyces sp. YKOK-I1]